MLDLKRLFVRDGKAHKSAMPASAGKGESLEPDSDYQASQRPGGAGLEVEYETLIASQFQRLGVEPDCITIEVKRLGQAPDGFDVMVGMVRLARWHRTSALRVMLGLPLLENKVRKIVRTSWLGDYSHFGGLWLHASEQLQSSSAPAELRELLMELAPPEASSQLPSQLDSLQSSPGGLPSGGDTASMPSGTSEPGETEAQSR